MAIFPTPSLASHTLVRLSLRHGALVPCTLQLTDSQGLILLCTCPLNIPVTSKRRRPLLAPLPSSLHWTSTTCQHYYPPKKPYRIISTWIFFLNNECHLCVSEAVSKPFSCFTSFSGGTGSVTQSTAKDEEWISVHSPKLNHHGRLFAQT